LGSVPCLTSPDGVFMDLPTESPAQCHGDTEVCKFLDKDHLE
jgi:hypothetical protein